MIMKIGIDYDDTYTMDPSLFDAFIKLARARLHEVYIVTMRHSNEPVTLGAQVNGVFYTGRCARKPFMEARGIEINVWIDDHPEYVTFDHISMLNKG